MYKLQNTPFNFIGTLGEKLCLKKYSSEGHSRHSIIFPLMPEKSQSEFSLFGENGGNKSGLSKTPSVEKINKLIKEK